MFNWALYGVLSVQTCESPYCIVMSGFLTTWAKTCIATIFRTIGGLSSSLVSITNDFSKRKGYLLTTHLTSILRLCSRDCPDCPHRMRCLLLVHGRVWRLGTTQTLQILSHRHPDNRRADLTHCPSIFLLPYLDLEQPHVVALSDHRHRTYHTLPFSFI